MDKTKIIPIILLAIIIGISLVVFVFYKEKVELTDANGKLKKEKTIH